jgi:hypothetical protein
MAKVLSLAPSAHLVQTVADVAFMLSDGGQQPFFENDVVRLCDRCDPRLVRIALRYAEKDGEVVPHPTVHGALVIGQHYMELARAGGFPDAA